MFFEAGDGKWLKRSRAKRSLAMKETHMRLTTYPRMLTRRVAWLIVALALIAVLALSACGRGGAQPGGHGGPGGTGGTGQTTAQTTDAAINDVAQADADLDAIIAALDSASLDASFDESAKDNPVQP